MYKCYISIVVPVYNAEPYIRECIESIVQQRSSFDDFELILVDDGSSDRSLSICREYEEYGYIRVFSHSNQGPSYTRNFGLERAEGKYILYVDADDYIEAGSLSKIAETCRRQCEPDILFLNGCKLYEGNRTVIIEKEFDYERLHDKSRRDVFEYLAGRNKFNGSPCLKMLKKQFLLEHSILFEIGKRCEDLDWSMDCYLNAKTYGCYNEVYYYYRQRIASSNSARFQDNSYHDWKNIIDKWITLSNNVLYNDISEYILQFACYEYIILLVNCKDYIKKDIAWHKNMQKLLFKYRSDKMAKIVRASCKIIGIHNTSRLLNFYYNIR